MIKSNENATVGTPSVDFSEMLNMMCHDNFFNTKKMAKLYLRETLNKNHLEDIQKGMKQIRGFLQIKDSLRKVRLEWIFGVG